MFNKPAQQQKNIDTDIPVQPQLTEQSKTSSFLSILKGFLSGNKFVYGMIGLLMLACIVWAYFIVWPIEQSYQVSESAKITYNAPTALPTAAPSPTPPSERWILSKTQNGETQEVASLCTDSYCGEFVFWQNLLIYLPDYDNNGTYDPLAVQGVNFDTDGKLTIFDSSMVEQTDRQPSNVNRLYVFDDTLFITVGGYLAGGGVYTLNLPPNQPAKKIYEGSNPRIEFWKNKYWIIGGEGDACWSGSNFSQIDLDTQQVSPMVSVNSGCYDGEEFIDLDNQGRIIVAGYDRSEAFEDNQIFSYIMAIPVSNPNQKTGLISKQDMPKGITKISYNMDVNQLYLYGETLYTYDLYSQKLQQVSELPEYIKHGVPYTQATYEEITGDLIEKQLPNGYMLLLK